MTIQGDYRVTCYFKDGSNSSELGFLGAGETEPDVTKMEFFENTEMVDIGFHAPLEHPLILNPEARLPPFADGWRFHARYYLNADILSYGQAAVYDDLPQSRSHMLSHSVRDAIRYGVDYAGYPVDIYGAARVQKEDMLYVYTGLGLLTVMHENSAVLTPMQKNSQGMLWLKANPFAVVHRL